MVLQPATGKKAKAQGQPSGVASDEVELWRAMVNDWKRLQRAAEKNLMRLDLTPAELRILRVLREQGSSPMNRFSSETKLSQPSITGIIDKLEERGLVERLRSKEDRREVLIAITAKGDQTYAKGMVLHRQFVERALSALKDGEFAALMSLIRRLADASDAAVEAPEISRGR